MEGGILEMSIMALRCSGTTQHVVDICVKWEMIFSKAKEGSELLGMAVVITSVNSW